MLHRITLLPLLALAFGCQNVPVASLPSVEVAGPVATGAATAAAPPLASSATAEPRKPWLTAKARAAKQALAACHMERMRPILPCDMDPSCRGPRDPPKTVKEKECEQFTSIGFGGSPDPGAGEPCTLLTTAELIDEMIEANDKASAGGLTIPEVAAAAADYRAALVEHSSANKDLADAKEQRDTSRIAADRLRIRKAIRLEEEADRRHGMACMD